MDLVVGLERVVVGGHERFGLALEVDGKALAETDAPFWASGAASIVLTMPDGVALTSAKAGVASSKLELVSPLEFSKILGSRTQAYQLKTTMRQSLAWDVRGAAWLESRSLAAEHDRSGGR